MATPAASSPATWSPARSKPTWPTPSSSPPAATATSSIFRPTPRAPTATAIWRAHKRGALFANPCFTQIHPTCIPVSGDYQSKLTLMCESLRNDGRIWVPKKTGDKRSPEPDSRSRARLLPGAPLPQLRQPRPARRRLAQRQSGLRRRPRRRRNRPRRLSRFRRRHQAPRRAHVIDERYGNLFDMYERITGEDPYKGPMRIYPAIHYTMGGLWVDYNLMSTIPGLFVLGEANFSDHGANRLGASALMQGLSDGYFVIPYTIGDYLATTKLEKVDASAPRSSRGRSTTSTSHAERLLAIKGKRTVASFHRELGKIMWDYCGMSRTADGLQTAIGKIRELREEFWRNVNVPGSARGPQPVARKRRPRGRLLGTRRADVHRRARAQRKLRRPFPRRIPDRGRRSPARRRALLLRRRLGV